MSVLIKEERRALCVMLERTYGIRIKEDDELLPILHYINDSAKLASRNMEESKSILNDMKSGSGKMIDEHHAKFKSLFNSSAQMLNQAATQSKEMILLTRRELAFFPKVVGDFKKVIESLNIPKQITIKEISFEDSTMLFLWRYFTISLLAFALIIIFSFLWFSKENKVIKKAEWETKLWTQLYYERMKFEAPEATKKFIKEYPLPAFIREKEVQK